MEPLVLLPGMNCSATLWVQVERSLANVAVIHASLDHADLDQCVAGLLTSLPDRFALAGLSLGGIVAMALVRAAPERVTRLCLMDTNAKAPTAGQRAAWDALIGRLEWGTTARKIQEELLPVLLRDPADADLRQVVLRMADETGEDCLVAQLRLQRTRVDERPGLARLQVPTLVLAGANDALCPPGFHQEIADIVPGARLKLLPETGHLSPLERAGPVARAMNDWLGVAT